MEKLISTSMKSNYFYETSTFMLVRVSPNMCLQLFFTAQGLNVCLFPRGVILKTTFCYLKPKWRKKARVCKSAHSRMAESHWLLAEDICMGTIGQVKGRYCDGCPLCKALCAQVGSFEWFLMMAPGLEISSHQAFKSRVGKAKRVL